MKRRVLCVMIGVFFGFMLSSAAAQQATSKQSSSVKLPADVCPAVQQYVAKIDAARSMSEAPKREETYTQAKKLVEPVLQRNKLTTLLDIAEEYAKLTEVVVKTDSTSPKLPELLEKRLKLRAQLLDHCDE